uniref:Integrase catalytic domain-containing protein n=1 Tax=Salix viminalis TaxID=40686 RepID=A0A6N2KNP9_SALVM
MAENSSSLLPLNTLSGSYGIWSLSAPAAQIQAENALAPNPAYKKWHTQDRILLSLLYASLTEECMAEVINCTTARDAWLALEVSFSHSSKTRELQLKDELQLMQRGSRGVAEYARSFRSLCDQLSAIGKPVDDTDKVHCPRALNHELFSRSLLGDSSSQTAMVAQRSSSNRFKSASPFPASGQSAKPFSATCQWCGKERHTAKKCHKLGKLLKKAKAEGLIEAFAATTLDDNQDNEWYTDTGATSHMTNDVTALDKSVPYTGNQRVVVGNGQSLSISRIGSISSLVASRILKMSDVLIVPHITKNLLSISKLTRENNCLVIFSSSGFIIQDLATRAVMGVGRCENGLYILDRGHASLFTSLSSCNSRASSVIWHARLGHPSSRIISSLNKHGVITFSDKNTFDSKPCFGCQLGKSHRLPFPNLNQRCSFLFERIHCDLWGPSPIPSPSGTEFTNHRFTSFLRQHGIVQRIACPYTPNQNGIAERKHRHITETGLTMMFHSHVPLHLWVESFSTACYLINRLPSPVLDGKTPHEILYGKIPSYSSLRTFGCLCFPFLRDYMPHKLSPRSIPCVFIGYSSLHKGFRCLDKKNNRVYVSRHVQFFEDHFPYATSVIPSSVGTDYVTFTETCDNSPCSENSSPVGGTPVCNQTPTHCAPCADSTPIIMPPLTHSQPSSHEIALEVPPSVPSTTIQPSTSTHPMVTRARDGIVKRRIIHSLCAFTAPSWFQVHLAVKEPRGFKSAVKNPAWLLAMDAEIAALQHNNTWRLVPRPADHNVVGCRWIFKTKLNADGSIERHKARLVAQGFSQKPGIDFEETFSPVVRPASVRIILSLAAMHRWPLRQLDVKNAFLHGFLSEEVYMEQPPGYIDPQFPTHVCRLQRALYGLKQAPRAWFQRFSQFLLRLGFIASRADSSLFVHHSSHGVVYLLLYVDDMVITGNNTSMLHSLIDRLASEFSMKDLGDLHYFLGIEVVRNDKGLFLSQAKYALDLLTRAEMVDCKPISTPSLVGSHLTDSGTLYSDATQFRSLAGALQYLTLTRPDLSYSVNSICQYMHAPTIDHFTALKRILRYVKDLARYSDADWLVACHSSFNNWISVILSNLISWGSKKQSTVARSSAEAEYRALATVAAELSWILQLLRELQITLPSPPKLLCDNNSAIFIASNPVTKSRSKHIDIDYHFVRELVAKRVINLSFVPSHLQLADVFTKAVAKLQFLFDRGKLCVSPISPTPTLRGDIRGNSDSSDSSDHDQDISIYFTVTLFANTLRAPYYEHVMGSSAQQFMDAVAVAERIEQEIRSGRISAPAEKRGFEGKTKDVEHFEDDYKGRNNQFQNYHNPSSEIANINLQEPLQPPYPDWYKSDLTCEYHAGAAGHSIHTCGAFKKKLMQLIKAGWITFDENPGGWPGGGGLGLVGVLPMRSQVRIRSGANNSLGPSDLGEALDLTVVHLWETCLPRPCAPPGLVRPSGLDTRG